MCAVLCLFGSCKENPGGNGNGEQIDDAALKLSLGDSYIYRWTMAITDSTKDSVSHYSEADTACASVDAINQKVDTLTGLVRMKSKLNHEPMTAIVWYRQLDSSLTELAYSSAGAGATMVLPKANRQEPAGRALASWNTLPRSVQWWLQKKKMLGDSAMKRDDPRVVYMYPLRVGGEWLSFSNPFPEYRRVVALVNVSAGGRNYACAKIKTTLPTIDANGDIEWYDYVGSAGLILRTMFIRGVVVTESSPDSAGVFTSEERLELLSTTKN
jgi:hypothetical protein